ncbi:MAG: hypothetical protein IT285_01145 [Bdellovibrionales bacterium]|nr:hypothetical protein [Bdellovibrionales bacterium]
MRLFLPLVALMFSVTTAPLSMPASADETAAPAAKTCECKGECAKKCAEAGKCLCKEGHEGHGKHEADEANAAEHKNCECHGKQAAAGKKCDKCHDKAGAKAAKPAKAKT